MANQKFKGKFVRYFEYAILIEIEGEDGSFRESIRLPSGLFHKLDIEEGDVVEFESPVKPGGWISRPIKVKKVTDD
jgi:hypothetical protein